MTTRGMKDRTACATFPIRLIVVAPINNAQKNRRARRCVVRRSAPTDAWKALPLSPRSVRAAALAAATVGEASEVGEPARQQCDSGCAVQRRIERHIVRRVISRNDLVESQASPAGWKSCVPLACSISIRSPPRPIRSETVSNANPAPTSEAIRARTHQTSPLYPKGISVDNQAPDHDDTGRSATRVRRCGSGRGQEEVPWCGRDRSRRRTECQSRDVRK